MSEGPTENNKFPKEISKLKEQLTLARREIQNLRQQLTTLNHVHKKEYEYVYQKLSNWQCSSCKSNQNSHSSSTQAETPLPSYDFQSKYIGIIHTNFPEKRGTPRQPGICRDMSAKLTLDSNVFTNAGHSIDGLQEFSHMWILFHFHKNEMSHVKAKVAPPRLNGIRTGVFATRSPHRPCPIGLSLVRIDRIVDGTIYFSGVDMVDQTPVLDIKPYIPQYDNPSCFISHNSFLGSLNNSEDLNISVGESQTSGQAENSTVEPTSRVLDGEEIQQRDQIAGASVSDNENSRLEESFDRSFRPNSRMGEREAPDGEEEESLQNPHAPLTVASTPEGQIRVPPWIDQPAVPRLTVIFRERATMQLDQLGPEGQEKRTAITNVLREDPRSVYLRERWSSQCYVFRIAELYISCKFNDNEQTVIVYQVFQNEVPPRDEE